MSIFGEFCQILFGKDGYGEELGAHVLGEKKNGLELDVTR